MFSSKKQDWETPDDLFKDLNSEFNFSWDLAARKDNTKANNFISPETNSLTVDWSKLEGNLFLNPPYGRELSKWIKKAYESSLERQGNIVLLIPSRTDTSYWHNYIFGKAEIRFLRGRIKFENNGIAGDAAPFPSAIVIYNNDERWKSFK
ncbi:adenine methyltransferase [Weissella coleopterorum]|uniref:Adenine methyltransferase n=2 Tax=Weissella coleopterorum TaxID=2714949 RepID=A0A6G8B1N5_9LACO|nr:adenine methyltransferase [Weissella coleopterorum]